MRTLSYGGAPIAPELVHRLMAAFPNARLGNGFGLSETAALATFLPHEYAADHADAVGFPTPVNDVRIDGRTREVGELLIRGPNVVAGYWGDPVRTAETFVDGWLHTGDVARIDDGIVRIVDRAKDMINRGGENVYCVEVENVLAAHPDVRRGGGGRGRRPGDGGEGGRRRPAAAGGDGRGRWCPSLIAFAREQLADFKVPQFVRVLDGAAAAQRRRQGAQGAAARRGGDWLPVPR